MSVTVGTNSWVTIAETDDYLCETMDSSEWFTLTTKQKTQRILTAYRWINQQPDISIPATSTATAVKYAQIELSLYIHNNWTEHKKREGLYNSGVRNFSVMSFSESLAGAKFPDYIKGLLKDYLTANGAFPRVERDFSGN